MIPMIRLGLMSATALAGMFLVMVGAGSAPVAQADAPGTAPLAGVMALLKGDDPAPARAEIRLAQAATVATDASPAPEVAPEPKAPRMPGPALRRSPEYAHRTAAPASAPASDPAAATAPDNALYVDANALNLRTGPSTADSVIGKLGRGDAVVPLGPVDNGWVEIQVLSSGKQGFTSAKFLSRTP